MSLVQLFEDFGGDDKACRVYLESLRWPDGPVCVRCGETKVANLEARNLYECASCGYQFSVTAGTVLHDTHLPLWKWMLAAYLMCESKKGISANQMKRTLKVAYKTAWYLCHRIRAAMGAVPQAPLEGVIEADESWIGGKDQGAGKGHWRDNKTMVLGALARDGGVRLQVDKRPTKKAIHAFLSANVDPDAMLMTDEHSAYPGWTDRHQWVTHRNEEWVRGDVHVNGIENAWGLFKRSIVGSYHQLSEKHLDAYLNEFEWRFNNRENASLFRDTLMALLSAEALPYSELIVDRP